MTLGVGFVARPQFAGRAPFALQVGASLGDTYGSLFALPAAGGTVLVPIIVPAPMMAAGVDLYCMDAADLHTAEWRLYRDLGASTLSAVPGMSGAFSFTPTGEDKWSSAADAVTRLFPGLYWLAVRNTSATVDFMVGQLSPPFYRHTALTQTLGDPLGDTLEGITGWAKAERLFAVAIAGAVMGDAAAF